MNRLEIARAIIALVAIGAFCGLLTMVAQSC